MELLIILPITISLAVVMAIIFTKYKNGQKLITPVHAILLTWIVLFPLNDPNAIVSEEIEFMEWTGNLFEHKKLKASSFLNDNVVYINNSFDKQLIPNPDGDQEDRTTIPITDRQTLIEFFKKIQIDTSLITKVVCDIDFSNVNQLDSLLEQSMAPLIQSGKILVAKSSEGTNPILHFPDHISGRISDKGKEATFLSHSITQNGNTSLAKLIADQFGSVKQPGHLITLNRFIPTIYLSQSNFENNVKGPTSRIWDLSETLSGNNFERILRERKERGQRNILFVGSFKGSHDDIHQTAYGDTHGALILLNIAYNLYLGENQVSFVILISLLISFYIISDILFSRALKQNTSLTLTFFSSFLRKVIYRPLVKWFKIQVKKAKIKLILLQNWIYKLPFLGTLLRLIGFAIGYIMEGQLHLIVMIIVSLLLYGVYGIHINLISLIVYLSLLESALTYVVSKILKKGKSSIEAVYLTYNELENKSQP